MPPFRNRPSTERTDRSCGLPPLLAIVATCVLVTSESFAQSFPNTSISVFLPAPRELQRELARAKDDIANERYVDAITRLNLILAGGSPDESEFDEDYFLPPAAGTSWRSFKLEVEQVIGALPPAGLEAYELAHGTEARQQLDAAISKRDYELIAETSRRYAHTKAGQEATMLLGRERLARGLAREALIHFQRLADAGSASKRFGAELQVLLATSMFLSDREDDALRLLNDYRIRNPSAQVTVRGERIPWFTENNLAKQWLLALVGKVRLAQTELFDEWHLFGGNLQRAGKANVEMPLRTMRWDVPFAQPDEEVMLRQAANSLRGNAATPVLHPLVVDGWVLMRSADKLWGVDLETGRRMWQYPPWPETSEYSRAQSVNPFARRGSQRMPLLKQRVWQDVLYGQLSSDGRAVYLLGKLTGSYSTRQTGTPLSNELIALDLQREGYSLWKVGGLDGNDQPALAGVFFLSPPLPIEDKLYSVGEVNGEVRLLALDKQTGQLLWSQQLASIDSRPRGDRGRHRRLEGLNLSYADGILICPTSLGGVVAIDLSRRTFLWGYQYGLREGVRRPASNSSSSRDRWRDNSTTISDGKVVLTPWDSNEMFCLDLVTGKNLWTKSRLRGSNFFVAGTHRNQIVLVGRSSVSAVDINTGEGRWSVKLKDNPAGRGIHAGRDYLLATTTPELVRIDLDAGKIVESVPTDEPLGNLVAAKDQIVSQNTSRLRAFYQRSKLEHRVATMLAKSPNDPWALEHQAILQLEDGSRGEGLESLRKAIANYPGDGSGDDVAAKQLMVRTALAMLRENAPGASDLVAEVEPYVYRHSETKNEILRVVTQNLRREGKLEEAFARNLDLFDSYLLRPRTIALRDTDELTAVSEHRRVRRDRWHRALFRNLWHDASEDQRQRMSQMGTNRVRSSPEDKRNELLSVLQDLPFAQSASLDVLRKQIDDGVPTVLTETRLLRLSASDVPAIAGGALASLADLYRSAGQYNAAASSYRKLAAGYADVVVKNDLSGASFVEQAVASNETIRRHVQEQPPWKYGEVRILPLAQDIRAVASAAGQFDTLTRLRPQLVETPFGRTPAGLQLVVDQGNLLQGRDAMGQIHPIATMRSAIPLVRLSAGLKVLTHGHLLVGVRGDSIVALNALRGSGDSDAAIIWQDAVQSGGAYASTMPTIRQIPFGKLGKEFTRTIQTGRRGKSSISVGAVTEYGVVLRRYGELICLDPETGERVWKRDDVDMAAEVWGDPKHIFAHVPASATGENRNARVFSTMDGTELESRPVADQSHRVRTFDQYILSWSYDVIGEVPKDVDDIVQRVLDAKINSIRASAIPPNARQVLVNRLQLKDVFDRTKTAEWTHTFAFEARAAFVNDHEVAVYDPVAERLQVFSIRDGQPIVDYHLKTKLAKVDAIRVERRAGLYVATLSQESTGRGTGNVVLYKAVPSANRAKLADMEVYAFDDEGEMVWGVPARLKDFVQPIHFARDIPVLIYLRQKEVSKTTPKRRLETVVLDVRDGHVILTDSNRQDGQVFHVRGDQELSQVHLRVPSVIGGWTLEFTENPRSPSPPYGYATNIRRNTPDGLVSGEPAKAGQTGPRATPQLRQ